MDVRRPRQRLGFAPAAARRDRFLTSKPCHVSVDATTPGNGAHWVDLDNPPVELVTSRACVAHVGRPGPRSRSARWARAGRGGRVGARRAGGAHASSRRGGDGQQAPLDQRTTAAGDRSSGGATGSRPGSMTWSVEIRTPARRRSARWHGYRRLRRYQPRRRSVLRARSRGGEAGPSRLEAVDGAQPDETHADPRGREPRLGRPHRPPRQPGRARVAAALVLVAPFVPMPFRGEEWSASTPFRARPGCVSSAIWGTCRTTRSRSCHRMAA
jgi:hypothetical protein